MPPGTKPFFLGVVLAVDQTHELAHDVAVIPRRPEGVFRHQPARREDDEIDVGCAFLATRRGQHGEDRRIGMVEQDRTDGRKRRQIIFVGRVVAVPRNNVERRMAKFGDMELAAPFDDQPARRLLLLEPCDRRLEVARIGKAVRADRSAVGHGELGAVILADVAPRRLVDQFDLEHQAARQHAISPGASSITPISVTKCSRPTCGTISSSPSALKKWSSIIERFAT